MIQVVNLHKGQVLTRNSIMSYLNMAKSSYEHVTFNLPNKSYITVHFNRDLTISVAHNLTDLVFYRELQQITQVYTMARLCDFLFRWLPKFCK